MQLIDEGFAKWYRKYSALALAVLGAINLAWAASSDVHELLSPRAMAAVSAAIAVLGFIGRFIKQTRDIIEQVDP